MAQRKLLVAMTQPRNHTLPRRGIYVWFQSTEPPVRPPGGGFRNNTSIYLCLAVICLAPCPSHAQLGSLNNGPGGGNASLFDGGQLNNGAGLSSLGNRPQILGNFLIDRINANNGIIPPEALPQIAPESIMTPATDLTSIRIPMGATSGTQFPPPSTKFLIDSHNAKGIYYLAGGACQPFFLQDNDDATCVVGSPGTVLAPGGGRNVVLKEGKLLAAAGKSPLIVKTIYAQIQITPGALAVIEQPRLGIMRAATLAGQGSAVVLTVADKQQDFTLCSGEELLIADKALNAIELVDPDGIERQPLEGKISVTGLLVQKNKFDIHAMVHHQHKLLVCNAGSFTISHPAYKFLAIEANKKYLGNQTPNIHIITAGHGPYVCLTQNE